MRRIGLAACLMIVSTTLAVAEDPARAEDKVPELAVLHRFSGLDIVETINHTFHGHGGPPAKLHDASINIDVRDARAHTIQVKTLEIVHANCKRSEKHRKSDFKKLEIVGYELHTWHDVDPVAKGTSSIKTPAGGAKRYSVKVLFRGITTYSGCAFAIDLVVDRVRKKIELPLAVTRIEPRGDEP